MYLTIQAFAQDLHNDERGMSDAVTTVLLVLVGVLAVVLIWGWLSGWLSDLFTNITGKAGQIN